MIIDHDPPGKGKWWTPAYRHGKEVPVVYTDPKRILGPNAKPVFWQFVFVLAVGYVASWLLWQPIYDLTGDLIAWLKRAAAGA